MNRSYLLPSGSRAPALAQFLSYGRDAATFLERNRLRFGPIFRCRFPWQPHVVVVSDAGVIDALLKMEPDEIPPYPSNHVIKSIFGSDSTLFKSGEPHRQDRDLMTPYLSTGASGAARQKIGEEIQEWLGYIVENQPVYDWAYRFTLRLTLKLFWGCDDAKLLSEIEHTVEQSRHRYESFLNMALDTVAMSPDLYPRLSRFAKWTHWSRRHELRSTFQDLINQLMKTLRHSETTIPDTPLTSRLRIHGDQPIDHAFVDFAMQLLIAAYDPPAATISWLLLELGRDPNRQDRIANELARRQSSPLLEACIQEVYRLYPPLHSITRTLTRDTPVGQYFLPSGTYLLPSIFLLHRESKHWERPTEFRPERFLNRSTRTIKDGFLPFGGSVRVCPGRHFATVLLRQTCAEFLRRFRWTTNGTKLLPPRTLGPTLVPDTAMSLTIRPRRLSDGVEVAKDPGA